VVLSTNNLVINQTSRGTNDEVLLLM